MVTVGAAIQIREESISELRRHIAVPSIFESLAVLDVLETAEGFELRERQLARPYRKDYDAVENPMEWPARFDVSKWALIAAFDGGERIGGAVVAFDSPGVEMLEERSDLLVLWDIRVSCEVHRRGVGSALFRAVESWALTRRCHELKVETQNTNVVACRFYEQQGCHLTRINRYAYPGLPDEVQLIWSKRLAPSNALHRTAVGGIVGA
jgi:GNAT superfamily N-acetyltransferase